MIHHGHLLVVLLAVAGTAMAAKLPPNIKRCARSDPAFSDCLRLALADALPKIKPGLPKLGVQPLDPLLISEMRLTQGGNGALNVDLTFTNMTSTQIFDGTTVESVTFDLDKMDIKAVTVTPHVICKSKYTAKGKVLLLPVVGTGDSRVDLYDVRVTTRVWGKRTKKADGKEYFEVVDAVTKLEPKKMGLRFDNLFNGDKRLGETMNKVLNENWELMFSEISPSLNEAYAELFKRPARALFNRVPIDDIVPEKL